METSDTLSYYDRGPGAAIPSPQDDTLLLGEHLSRRTPLNPFLKLLIGSASPSSTSIFLHERNRPDGKTRLVAMFPINRRTDSTGRSFIECAIFVFDPGTIFRRPVESISLNSWHSLPAFGDTMKIYSGQPDPLDHSHFTIELKTFAERFICDGWLRNDDTVVLEPRPPVPIPVPTSSPASSQ